MNADQFRVHGKELIDFITDYLENIRERRTYPDVKPGYLIKQLPKTAPHDPESWNELSRDIEELIMPGVGYYNPLRNIHHRF